MRQGSVDDGGALLSLPTWRRELKRPRGNFRTAV
jgi:hypothetical protein